MHPSQARLVANSGFCMLGGGVAGRVRPVSSRIVRCMTAEEEVVFIGHSSEARICIARILVSASPAQAWGDEDVP